MVETAQLAPMVIPKLAFFCPTTPIISSALPDRCPLAPSTDLLQPHMSAKHSPSPWNILSGTFLSFFVYAHSFLKRFCFVQFPPFPNLPSYKVDKATPSLAAWTPGQWMLMRLELIVPGSHLPTGPFTWEQLPLSSMAKAKVENKSLI